MEATGALMGRPKKQENRPAGPRTVGVRALAEWAQWLDDAAKHCRTDIAKLIDVSVAEYVKSRGYDVPPPDRVP